MRLYIPPKDSELTLIADWTFPVYHEGRNNTLVYAMGTTWPNCSYWDQIKQFQNVTLPAGTKLKVDRIYIRSGQSDYDSITFFITTAETERLNQLGCWKRNPNGSVRFWVALEDANNLEYNPDSIVSPSQREVGKVLQKLLNKKTATVAALATTAEVVLKQMSKDLSSINFHSVSFDTVHLEHMATALRTTYTYKDEVPGWKTAIQWCERRCNEIGIDANDMLYGLLDN